MSLRTQIVLLVVVLLIAGIWGLAARITAVLQSELERLLAAQLSSSVGIVAGEIDNKIRLRIEAMNRMAALITPDMLADPAKLQRLLEQPSIVGSGGNSDFFIANKQGIVVADYPQIPGRVGASVANRAHFLQAMASGNPVIGTPLKGQIGRRRLIVPIAVPLREASGVPAGVLIDPIVLTDPSMFGELEKTKLGETGFFVVMSPKDHLRVLASGTYQNQALTPLPAPGVNPLLDRRLREGFEGSGITVNSYGTEVLTVSRNMTTTGWLLLGGVETKEIFAPIANLKRQVYLAALIISLLIAAILRFTLARQFARLERASEAMRRMTAGEQPLAAIPVTREDEIGKLIGNFNRLAGERNRLDEERKQANEALEKAMRRLQALSDRITMIREEERREIAFELHEQSAQELSALKIQLEMLRFDCRTREAQARLQAVLTTVRSMQEQLRNMAVGLHSPQLNDFGLYATLRTHCNRQANAADWVLYFDAPDGGERPPREIELACFRVVEEALTNVASHANATEIWVNLSKREGELHLNFRDNGVGFVTGEISDSMPEKNLGLFGMAERTRQVGGRLEIKSRPGGGTEIFAAFPLRGGATQARNPPASAAPVFSTDSHSDLPDQCGGNSTTLPAGGPFLLV